MKRFLLFLLSAVPVFADPVIRPATQAEVNAGIATQPYVSPATLAGYTGGGSSAEYFINLAGITDQTEKNNINYAIADLNQMGVFSNVVTAGILEPLANPSNHFDILGNKFSFTNEQYFIGGSGAAGANMQTTNLVVITLPRAITNFTLVLWYWQNCSNVDRLVNNNPGLAYATAQLYDSVSGAGFVPDIYSTKNGLRVWSSSSGTNYNTFPNPINTQTNGAQPMINGQYDSRIPLGSVSVVAYSGGTNGLTYCFYDGKPCYFKNGGANSYSCQLTTNIVYNTLTIGGAGTSSWGLSSAGFCTNSAATIGGWILFDNRSDGDWRYQAAGYKFATDLTRYSKVMELGGSSIVNIAYGGGNTFLGGTQPETNSLGVIFQQMNPDTLTLVDAAPGSSMANYGGMNSTGTNYYFPYDMFFLNTNRFPSRVFESDGPRNDALGAIALLTLYPIIQTNWNYYFVSGIPVGLIDTHWDYSTSLAGNLNWRATEQMIESNLPISFVVREAENVSSNFISLASIDNPPRHANAPNWQAYQLDYMFACLCSGRPNPYPWLAVAYNTISSGSLLNNSGNALDAGITNINQLFSLVTDAQGNQRVTQDDSEMTNGFANAVTYTNFLFSPNTYTNTTTRSALVSVNAQCSPTTVVTARFAIATSPTGATFTTNAAIGLDADTIFTTIPHAWFQTTTIVPPGGIWKVVDITAGGAVMITNSYWQTLQ